MKRIAILLLILTSYTLSAQNDYLQYPDYRTVLEQFYQEYSTDSISLRERLTFGKSPEGWIVQVTDVYTNPSEIKKNELFWSLEKKRFLPIDILKRSEADVTDQREIEVALQHQDSRYYSISPYFGYVGWDWDVIQKYTDFESLPDSVLYAVGRAYSSYARNLLNNHTGKADPRHRFKLPLGQNSMSAEQLAKYRKYRHTAIQIYHMVEKHDPEFMTVVGKIGVKTSNEYVTSYLDLIMYQNEEEAKKELKDGLYSKFMIEYAINFLNTCAPNAILFTNGDNDTFPLLYVQEKMGVRKDVTLVNMTLFDTERYINHFYFGKKKLPLSVEKEKYAENLRPYVMLDKDAQEPISVDDALDFMLNDENLIHTEISSYLTLPHRQFNYTVDGKSIEWNVEGRYITKGKIVFLDMLRTNQWKRPIYFSSLMSKVNYFGLDHYLRMEGIAYRLTSQSKGASSRETGYVGIDEMTANLTKKYTRKYFHTATGMERRIAHHQRLQVGRLAQQLIFEGRKKEAKRILDKGKEWVPEDSFPYDILSLGVVAAYYSIDEDKEANRMVKKIVSNVRSNYAGMERYPTEDVGKSNDYILEYLRVLLRNYHQQDLMNSLGL